MRFVSPTFCSGLLALFVLGVWRSAVHAGSDQKGDPLRAEWYFQEAPGVGRARWPTHIYRDSEWEIITDLKGCRLIYRRRAEGETWRVSPVALKQSHSVERLPNGRFIIADTDDHRMVSFDRLDFAEVTASSTIAGLALLRPHDALFCGFDSSVYVVDSHRRLYRFDPTSAVEESWPLGDRELGYARALSFFDGALHVINSSDGEVLRIDDFAARRFTRYRSFGKKKRAPAGAFGSTGFVLNDVEKWDGWYYGTNYFCPTYADGADPDELRLLRWKSWNGFASGDWEDLSCLLPPRMVPYFLTVSTDGLFVAVFDHESEADRDGILEILTAQ